MHPVKGSEKNSWQAPHPGKTLVVMQPYFFPHIGYFQLMAAADVFIAYDDAKYIKQGWINRNRILRDGAPVYLMLPVVSGHHNLLICEKLIHDAANSLRKAFEQICRCYRTAPHFRTISSLLEPLFRNGDTSISRFNLRSLIAVRDYLDIATPIVTASERHYGYHDRGQDRILRICQAEDASHYINAPRAVEIGLYSPTAFAARGMELSFLRPAAAIT